MSVSSDAATVVGRTPAEPVAGNEPELRRTLGSFQVFAISFAFISVAVGIFATYSVVLKSSGPVGIWLWVVVAAGQILVALVYAQFAGRIPLSGSSYQWASQLTTPKIGWAFGWLTVCYLALGAVTVDNALASTALMPLLGIHADEGTARLITVILLVIQAGIVVGSTALVGRINAGAVATEFGVVLLLTIALIVAVLVTGGGKPENLISSGAAGQARNYLGVGGGLMSAMIMGLATLVGFDSCANLAEEAKEPLRSVPRAIVGSVAAASLLGLVFLIVLTIAIGNVPHVTASDSPIAEILRDQLSVGAEKVFLIGIVAAFFGAGVAIMAACSRVVYTMSRDSRFPAHRLLRRVNPRTRTPVPATLLVVVVGVVLMVALPGAALLKLIIAGTILPAVIYGSTICLYLAVRGRLGRRPGAFNLGRFELPVAIAALLWVLVALFVLVSPAEALVPVLIVVGLVVVGLLCQLALMTSDRQAFETGPEAPEAAQPIGVAVE